MNFQHVKQTPENQTIKINVSAMLFHTNTLFFNANTIVI